MALLDFPCDFQFSCGFTFFVKVEVALCKKGQKIVSLWMIWSQSAKRKFRFFHFECGEICSLALQDFYRNFPYNLSIWEVAREFQ